MKRKRAIKLAPAVLPPSTQSRSARGTFAPSRKSTIEASRSPRLGTLSASDESVAGAWAFLVGQSAPLTYPPGVEVVAQGELAESVYLISKGLVKLTHLDHCGRITIVGLRSPGWILGAAEAMPGRQFAFGGVTLARCVLHRVPAARFQELVRRRASLSWYIHLLHAREIREQLLQIAGLGSLSARERLELFLARLLPNGTASGGAIRLEMSLRLWEVAQLVAITPPYLSDLLRELEDEGIIRRQKGWVYVLRPDLLPLANGE